MVVHKMLLLEDKELCGILDAIRNLMVTLVFTE